MRCRPLGSGCTRRNLQDSGQLDARSLSARGSFGRRGDRTTAGRISFAFPVFLVGISVASFRCLWKRAWAVRGFLRWEADCSGKAAEFGGFAVNMLSLVRVQREDGSRAGPWRRRSNFRCNATWYPCAGKLAGRQPLAKSGWLLLPCCARRCSQARLGAAFRVSQLTRRLPSPRGSRFPNWPSWRSHREALRFTINAS